MNSKNCKRQQKRGEREAHLEAHLSSSRRGIKFEFVNTTLAVIVGPI